MRVFILIFMLISVLPTTAQAKPKAEDFGILPSLYDAAISPDAKQIAVYINVEGTYGVRILNIENRQDKPRIRLLGKGVKPQWLKWVNNDRVLVSLTTTKNERSIPYSIGTLYSLDATTMKGDVLIKPRGIFRQFNNVVVDFLEDDPEHILMSFSDSDVTAPDIQKVNVETGRYSRVRRGRENIQYWYTDLSGTPRVGQGLSERSKKEEKWFLLIRDADSDKWRNADEYPGLEPESDIIGFTDNPNELIIRARNGRDTKGLYIYNLVQKGMSRTLFHDDDYDAGSVILSSDGSRVIGAKFVSDEAQTKLFEGEDTVLERVRQKNPEYTVQYIDQSTDGGLIVFSVSNAYDPGSLMIIDAKTEVVTALGKFRSELKPSEMGSVISVKYTARDGLVVPAYVTLPPTITQTKDLKNLPFIILPHGGPYARSSKRFDYFAQFFATQGYGVLQMNFRGSAGYGKSYEDAGRKNWVVMQEDVEDGARWLLEKGYADPERLCIAGWSFGGYAALMGSIKNPDIYKCGISMAGITDIADLIRDAKKYRFGGLAANQSILSGFDDRDEIKENSPAKRADELVIPLFLAHGEDDQAVHFDQFTRMKRALKKSPAKVTYMEFKEEDHYLSYQANRQKFFKGLEKFLISVNGKSEFAQE